jgi:hypothetical protein
MPKHPSSKHPHISWVGEDSLQHSSEKEVEAGDSMEWQ